MDATTQTIAQNIAMLIIGLLCLVSIAMAWSNRRTSTQQASSQAASVRVKRMGLNLNMGIAATHKVTTQVVGIQLSGANLLAIAVSAASVVAGTVMLAIQQFPGALLLWAAAGAIGIGLAFLIEGMTLGALIRIRLANKEIRKIEDRIENERDEQISKVQRPAPMPDPKAYKDALKSYNLAIKAIDQDYRRRSRSATRLHRRNRNSSIPLAAVGALASACAGGLFYHSILSGFNTLENFALSALFALVVTGTFVSSELFKDIQEQAIKEGFEGNLAETAIEKETRRLLSDVVHTQVVAYVSSPQARDDLKEDTRAMLKDVMLEIRQALRKSDTTTRQQAGDNMTPGTITGIQEINDTTPVLSEATTRQGDATADLEGDKATRQPSDSHSDTSPDTTANATGAMTSQPSEAQPDNATPRTAGATDDKLARTLEFFEVHPEYVMDQTTDLDTLLAEHLGMSRPASARFWKHKALEILQRRQATRQGDTTASNNATSEMRQSNSDTTGRHDKENASASDLSHDTTDDNKDTHAKIVAYATRHPDATQQAIADALGISTRTLQRHLKAKDTEPRQPALKVVR